MKKFNFQPLISFFNSTKDTVKNHRTKWVIGLVVAVMSGYIYSPPEFKTTVQSGLRSVGDVFTADKLGPRAEDGVYHYTDFRKQFDNDHDALQAIFEDIQTTGKRSPQIELDNALINLYESVWMPITTNALRMSIDGEGAIINLHEGTDGFVEHPELRNKAISYGSDDNNAVKFVGTVWIDNIIFRGKNGGGGTAIRLVAQRQSIVENCSFENVQRAITAIWCQQCLAENNAFQFQDIHALEFRSAVSDATQITTWGELPTDEDGQYFSNATTSNSQSNRSTSRNNWYYGKPGQIAQLRVQGSDGVTSENDVFEGASTRYAVHADSRNSTTTHTLNLIRPHIEQGGSSTDALIYAREFRNLYIDKLYTQIPGVKVLKTEGNIGQVIFDNLCFFPADNESFDSHNQIKYVFNNPVQGISNFASWDRWAGAIPKEIFWERGVDMYSLGSQGLSLRSDTYINGRKQKCYWLMHGNSITQRGINYESRGTNYTVFKKSNLNDL